MGKLSRLDTALDDLLTKLFNPCFAPGYFYPRKASSQALSSLSLSLASSTKFSILSFVNIFSHVFFFTIIIIYVKKIADEIEKSEN